MYIRPGCDFVTTFFAARCASLYSARSSSMGSSFASDERRNPRFSSLNEAVEFPGLAGRSSSSAVPVVSTPSWKRDELEP